jgi:hypothetical protein
MEAPSSQAADQQLFLVQAAHCSIELAAPNFENLNAFLDGFNPEASTYANPWSILSRLVQYEIDWPLWHEHHRRVFTQKIDGTLTHDPWEHSESYPGNIRPVDFQKMMHALIELFGPHGAGKFCIFAWYSLELFEPNAKHNLAEDRKTATTFLTYCKAAKPACEAPLALLLERATKAEFMYAFHAAGLRRPVVNDRAIQILHDAGEHSVLVKAFRQAPRWKEAKQLLAPNGFSWSQFQDFRSLGKCLASDLAAYFTGFRIFRHET